MTPLEAMKQALEALEARCGTNADERKELIPNLHAAIEEMEKVEPTHEEALAKPEQEPVAWRIKVHKYDEETDESSFPWEYHHIRGEGQPLYLHPAPAIPEGWQLVPKEPTPEMIRSGQSEYGEVVFAEHQVNSVYRDMLAAAPKPIEVE